MSQSTPDTPSHGSSSPTPSLQTQYPALHAATDDSYGGHRSFLDVIFDVRLEYGEVRTLILQGLTTVDFDNLRRACRSIDHCLMKPSATGNLGYPPDLIDKCHETGLPVPPSLPPCGSCPNPPQSTVRIRACQLHDHFDLRNANPHQANISHPRGHLVCEVCRRNWHHNIGTNPFAATPNRTTRHNQWRVLLARAHITLCGLCDLEQKRHHPAGHDGCLCYREYYKTRWLCQRCDVQHGFNVHHDIGTLTARLRHLKHVPGKTPMQIMPDAQGPRNLPQWLSWCLCGRQVSEPAPGIIQAVPTPWPGNHNLIVPMLNHDTGRRKQTTKQCVLCCGYIVPPGNTTARQQPVRRSVRLADRKSGRQRQRKHTMLDRSGKRATRHEVSGKGFEVRARGGWS